MPIRISLDKLLETRGITTYRLMKQLEGRVARGTVYGIASGKTQRIDMDSLSGILDGLHELTGETVTPNDLFTVMATPTTP